MKKAYCILLCIFIFFSFICISTQAANADLSLAEISEEEKLNISEKFTLFKQQNNTDAFSDAFIYCLSVSENEQCAILLDNATIAIYDSNGELFRVLKFNENFLENLRVPSRISIAWENDNLQLLYPPQEIILLFDLDGNPLDVYQYEYDASIVYSPTQYTVNDTVYQLEYSSPLIHYLGGNRYNILSKTTAGEETTILFKSSESLPRATISALFTFAFVFMTPCIIALYILYKKKQKRQ